MLLDTLNDDLRNAMKARNTTAVNTLRLAISAVRHAELAAPGDTPSDEAVRTVLAKEVKRRHEAATIYDDNDRPDAAAAERAEAEVLGAYLPAELTDDEISELVAVAVASCGATSTADMGTVMKAAKAAASGRADGARLAAAVRTALGS